MCISLKDHPGGVEWHVIIVRVDRKVSVEENRKRGFHYN